MHRRLNIVILATAVAACGSGGTVSYTGVKLEPNTLQFGAVTIRQKAFRKTTLTNEGTNPIVVERIEIVPDVEGAVLPFRVVNEVPFEVGRSEAVDIEVAYEPTVPNARGEADRGTLVVVTNIESLICSLVAEAVSPQLVATPPALEYGEIEVGNVADRVFSVENQGNQAVTVTGVEFRDAQGDLASPGLFVTDESRLKRRFEPGDSVRNVRVTYEPTAGRVDDGVLVLLTDSEVQPRLEVSIKAKALAAVVTLCYKVEGAEDFTCLPRQNPDGRLLFADTVAIGGVVEGESKQVTVVLHNHGNLAAPVTGLLPSGGQTEDTTYRNNPCTLPQSVARQPDYTFAPGEFTQAEPGQPQEMVVTYTPHHDCINDLHDRGTLTIGVRLGARVQTYMLDFSGETSRPDIELEEGIAATVDRATAYPFRIKNKGPGPLKVVEAVLVTGGEGDTYNCAAGCDRREPCPESPDESTPVECRAWRWEARLPMPVTVPPYTSEPGFQIGTVIYDPDTQGIPAQGTSACVRIRSNDPFDPLVCGRLWGAR